ncbi:LuxR C-terminal-related transcriptional regulator [Moheibacter stercoris]|uniref:DNA-binding NarL/FixJ family response regulator n=1 Tax=Moheibacter stercoris TaxID=1628251 RepID=A0ABV2LW33_9FLAO
MDRNLFIYLAIENPMLLKGIESLILSQINSNAKTICILCPEDLFQLDWNQDEKSTQILIYDESFRSEKNNLMLLNLLKSNPTLKSVLLVRAIDYHHLKLLYNLGFTGVANKDINPKDFVDFMRDIIKGNKALAPKFQKLVIGQFCQIDKNFNQPFATQMYEDDINHFQELYGLTKREKEILCLICNGKNTKEISEELFISMHTAETHRRNLLAKLDVKNTAQMVKVAVMNKLVTV